MKVSLTPITKDNWKEVVLLSTDNRNATIKQEYVAVNAISIVKYFFEKSWEIQGIVVDNNFVGFTMYGFNSTQKFYQVQSLMIDRHHQQHGYGGEALVLVIDKLKEKEDCKEIYITCLEDNTESQKLFEDLGFKDTGRMLNEEKLYKLAF